MAFTRPTLTEIIDRVEGDIKSGLGLATILRRSFLKVIARALAGAAHTLHGHIVFATDQLFPQTQNETFLTRFGNLFGITRNPAVAAELNVTIVGTTGGTVPLGTVYQRSDGAQYLLKAEVIVGALSTEPGVLVASDAGLTSNVTDGSTLTALSPIGGVESDVVVNSTAIEGEDQEGLEAFRTRIIERVQNPPAGGKVTDYIAFAKISGVTRVWVLPNEVGVGTVTVAFVEDEEDPIFPSQAKVDEVQIAVNGQKPVTATAFVIAPSEFPLNPVIQLSPNTPAVQEAVQAELDAMILREGEVGNALDPENVGLNLKFSGKISLSKINEAISIADGEDDHILVFPTTDITPLTGGLVSVGTITFSGI